MCPPGPPYPSGADPAARGYIEAIREIEQQTKNSFGGVHFDDIAAACGSFRVGSFWTEQERAVWCVFLQGNEFYSAEIPCDWTVYASNDANAFVEGDNTVWAAGCRFRGRGKGMARMGKHREMTRKQMSVLRSRHIEVIPSSNPTFHCTLPRDFLLTRHSTTGTAIQLFYIYSNVDLVELWFGRGGGCRNFWMVGPVVVRAGDEKRVLSLTPSDRDCRWR
ncbi:hypothetical protein KSP40_PGU006575 [Platanthera guangdongensis]|uniref:Uncharacterized protein n=1 Tax=Platanthera guangdongensis TaxID=2320717 RepID=A0ABR2MRF2_9ASPA